MRKFGIFSALYSMFFSPMFLRIGESDGAGGEADMDDGADGDIGEADIAGDNGAEFSGEDGSITVPKDEWERVNSFVEDGQRQAAFESAISTIKEDIPDFNEKAVIKHLKEMHKKDPNRAHTYNNEAGFKAIWYEMQQKAAKNDDTNGGKNKGSGGSDFESVFDGAMQGKPGSLKQAISMAL